MPKTMTPQVICIKIAQARLPREAKRSGTHSYQYFPFDRVYVTPMEFFPALPRLFRYFFYMPLDVESFNALNDLTVESVRTLTVERDDEKSKPQALEDKQKTGVLRRLIKSPASWTLVIPTHIKGRFKKDKMKAILEASQVMYMFSKVLKGSYGRNANTMMPRIALHTPQRDIPVACAVCDHLPSFHAGDCNPGRGDCAKHAQIVLPPDDHFRQVVWQASTETGNEDVDEVPA